LKLALAFLPNELVYYFLSDDNDRSKTFWLAIDGFLSEEFAVGPVPKLLDVELP
jgi:hypothetical protein